MDNETRKLAGLYRSTNATACHCPDGTVLARLAEGTAWPWQRRRVTAHLSECVDCADAYRALLTAREGLRDALDLPPAGSRAGWLGAPAAAGVAAVAVVGLVSAIALHQGHDPSALPATAASSSGPDTIFASDFGEQAVAEAGSRAASDDDQLFSSDFDARRGS